MAILIAGALLLEEQQDEEADAFERNEIMRVTRRLLRDTLNPFSVSNSEFRKLYRLVFTFLSSLLDY